MVESKHSVTERTMQMSIAKYIRQQMDAHAAMTAQDVVKLCYQGAYGPGHLLADAAKAKAYFDEEFEAVVPSNIPLAENISHDYCRINLGAWKNTSMPSQWLFEMFRLSAVGAAKDEQLLLSYLDTAERFIPDGEYLEKYKASGMPAVHHSEEYRAANHPAYRVVSRDLARLLPILEKAAEKDTCVIAIDGRAASGKTTMANQLESVMDAAVIHMDDFFLPGELRTQERLAEPGGNIHYERFTQEVLPGLLNRESFDYRKFDCRVMDYAGRAQVKNSRIRIVEGSYSCHPVFGQYADIRVFTDIDPVTQMERIIMRNGDEMAERFKTQWIPMEEEYFARFNIKEKADIIF